MSKQQHRVQRLATQICAASALSANDVEHTDARAVAEMMSPEEREKMRGEMYKGVLVYDGKFPGLGEEEVAFFRENGYVIPKNFRLSEEVLAAIRKRHDRLIEDHPDLTDYAPALYPYDIGFLQYARNPDLVKMVSQLIGDDIVLWNSSFFAKPPSSRGPAMGRKTPYHQDLKFWTMLEPSPKNESPAISIWVAIDDATKENGCLWMMPKSHKAKKVWNHVEVNDPTNLSLNQVVPMNGRKADLEAKNPCDVEMRLAEKQGEAEFDARNAVPIELKAGQISIHDGYMVHGSDANNSGKPRRGMTIRMCPSTTLYNRETSLYPSDMPIFLLKGQPGANKLNVAFS